MGQLTGHFQVSHHPEAKAPLSSFRNEPIILRSPLLLNRGLIWQYLQECLFV